MKTKHIISAAVACILLTGCAATESNSPNVRYSGLFAPNNASSRVEGINGKAAAPGSDDDGTDADVYVSPDEDPSVTVSRSANAAAADTDTSDSDDIYVGPEDGADSSAAAPDENTSSSGAAAPTVTAPNAGSDTSTIKINNPRPASVIFTDAQAVADLQFGDICYFAYDTGDEELTESDEASEPEDSSETEEDQEDSDNNITKVRPKTKYDYGYKVIFRTNTDTYLLGITPYGQCKWDDVNDMCRKISDLIEADCSMVGIPSLEDLQYLTDCGIYLPGQYEMWTSTPANPKGNKVYFRNKKGAFYSTKSKTDTCGVCAIIRISTTQNDPELLSSSLSNYEEAKARLEAEEEQYNSAISGEQGQE